MKKNQKKSVVLAGPAMQCECEVRRVSQRRQNMPWSRNQNHNQRTAEGMKPFPGSSSKELACKVKIDYPGSHRKYDGDQALQQQPRPQAGSEDEAHKRGWDSSSSRAHRNAHIAKAVVKVRMTSGIRIRVNKNNPAHVAMHIPA